MKKAQRISTLPPYIFAEVDKVKRDLRRQGVDLIDLGVGDPDRPTPQYVVDRLISEAPNPEFHRYPEYEGSALFRQAISTYYRKRFGVDIDPNSEVMALIGSKEGLSHLIWAFVEPGAYALIPDPGYPVYQAHTLLAGGTPYMMPLTEEGNFLPDLDAIPDEVAQNARIMFLNYPNNPTAAVATVDFFEKAIAFARKHDILICHDAAYVEMTYDGYIAPSILEVPGAKDVAVESYSLSKPFNMTGWRIAAMVGCKEAISALRIIKTNTDSGQFTAVQMAGVEALEHDPKAFTEKMNQVYKKRRDALVGGLKKIGLAPIEPKGSFYVWCPVPAGHTSGSFAELLLKKAHVIVVPGRAYGEAGEGFVRFALTVEEPRLEEAVNRITAALM